MRTKPSSRVIFKVKEPQTFLKEHGFVYTLRRKRKEGYCRIYFDNEMVAIGYIEEIGHIHKIDLSKYSKYSGFKSAEQWYNKARKMYKNNIHSLYLYKVTVIEWMQ